MLDRCEAVKISSRGEVSILVKVILCFFSKLLACQEHSISSEDLCKAHVDLAYHSRDHGGVDGFGTAKEMRIDPQSDFEQQRE